MSVARNVMIDARLVPGGGAVEMALAHVSSFSNVPSIVYHVPNADIVIFSD